MLSDQGVSFENETLKQLLEIVGTKKLRSSTYNGAGNGGVERLNKTVKPALAKFVNTVHDDWDNYLQLAISSYNNTTHSSTGLSPFEALFNRPPVLLADIMNSNV